MSTDHPTIPIRRLAEELKSRVIRPGAPDYHRPRTVFYGGFDHRPGLRPRRRLDRRGSGGRLPRRDRNGARDTRRGPQPRRPQRHRRWDGPRPLPDAMKGLGIDPERQAVRAQAGLTWGAQHGRGTPRTGHRVRRGRFGGHRGASHLTAPVARRAGRLSEIVDRVRSRIIQEIRTSGRPVIVTRHGRPVAALWPIDEEALEDFVLACAPEFVESMREAEGAYRAGRVQPAEGVYAELGIEQE